MCVSWVALDMFSWVLVVGERCLPVSEARDLFCCHEAGWRGAGRAAAFGVRSQGTQLHE